MDAGRVCSRCEVDEVWPAHHDFAKCPRCGLVTTYVPDADPMDVEGAHRVIQCIEFDRYYAQRETARDAEAFAALKREIDELPETPELMPERPWMPLRMRWDRGIG